jgi:hypothetical protein
VPASEYRALQQRAAAAARQEDLETKCCAPRLNWRSQKSCCVALAGTGRHAVKTIADALGVARSNLAVQAVPGRTRQRRGPRPQPETELVAEIKALIAGQPTYGYRRIRCCGVSAANTAVRQ